MIYYCSEWSEGKEIVQEDLSGFCHRWPGRIMLLPFRMGTEEKVWGNKEGDGLGLRFFWFKMLKGNPTGSCIHGYGPQERCPCWKCRPSPDLLYDFQLDNSPFQKLYLLQISQWPWILYFPPIPLSELWTHIDSRSFLVSSGHPISSGCENWGDLIPMPPTLAVALWPSWAVIHMNPGSHPDSFSSPSTPSSPATGPRLYFLNNSLCSFFSVSISSKAC